MSDIDFRSVGFTSMAEDYPRSTFELELFSAFTGYPADKFPEACHYFPNEWTQTAWRAVAKRAIEKAPIRITGVAVCANDLIYAMPAPNRHCDIMFRLFAVNKELFNDKNTEQGFITTTGEFVNRRQGLRLALAAGQVLEENLVAPPELFSEDLW